MRRRIRRRARTTVSPPVIFGASGSAFPASRRTAVGRDAGRLVSRWRRVEEGDRAQDAVRPSKVRPHRRPGRDLLGHPARAAPTRPVQRILGVPDAGWSGAGAGDALGRTRSATCRTEPLRVGAQRVPGRPRRELPVGRRGRLASRQRGPRHHVVTRGGPQTSSMRVALTAAARTTGRRPVPPTRSTPPSRSATPRSPARS
jgi:hypothetical protein